MEEKIKILLNQKKELEKNLEETIRIRNSMEGKMQSRYDTQREEWAFQCEIIENQISQVNQIINEMMLFNGEETKNAIVLGSIVRLRINNEDAKNFILLNEGGGHKMEDITTISIKSPVGKKLLGKKEGETLKMFIEGNEVTITVIEIQCN